MKSAEDFNTEGNRYFDQGHYRKAIECYDEAIQIRGNFKDVLYNKGNALSALGRKEEAIVCYDRAISLDENYAFAWNGKGAALYDLERKEEAIECYNRAITLDGNYKIAWNNKGVALYNLGQKEDAIECFDRAIALDETYTLAWQWKIYCLKQLGNDQNLKKCLLQARDIYGDKLESTFGSDVTSILNSTNASLSSSSSSSSLSSSSSTNAIVSSSYDLSDPTPSTLHLDSTLDEFLAFSSKKKHWADHIIQNIRNVFTDQGIFSVESIMECWVDCIEDEDALQKSLKKQIWHLLFNIFREDQVVREQLPEFFSLPQTGSSPARHVASTSNASSSSSSDTIPSTSSGLHIPVNEYIVVDSVLHRGSNNVVFKAHHSVTGTEFALKVYHDQGSRDHESCIFDSLPRSDYIVSKITSFNLLPDVLESLNLSPRHIAATVFEFGSTTLESVCRDFRVGKRRSKFKEWLYDAAFATCFLHEYGLVHFDIKPSNFIFCSHFLKLIDLECCRKAGEKIGKDDSAPGTPMFASRKVLYHNKERKKQLVVDPIFDIHSFGYLVYYVLTGTPLAVDAARLMEESLDSSADMDAVSEICLHPDFHESRVVQDAIQQQRIDEQEGSLIRKALSGEASMIDIIQHPYFGVKLSDTQLKQKLALADHGRILQSIDYKVEDIMLGQSSGSSL